METFIHQIALQLLMSAQEFGGFPCESGVLTKEEQLDIFRIIARIPMKSLFIEARVESTFRFKFENISRRKTDGRLTESQTTIVRNLPWCITAEIEGSGKEKDDTKYFKFYLMCDVDLRSAKLSCYVEYELRMIPQKEGCKTLVFQSSANFSPDGTCRGPGVPPTLREVLDPANGWMKDDSVILEAWISAEIPTAVNDD